MSKPASWMDPISTLGSKSSARSTRKTAKTTRIHGYALKLNGKVVSDRKLQRRAYIWVADDLTRAGRGGGIVNLLLPQSEKELQKLASDRKKYTLSEVVKRAGGRRKALRKQVGSPELLWRLVEICPAQPTWEKQDFVDWLLGELEVKGSPARNVVLDLAPDLLRENRKRSWWCRNIGVNKMSR